MKRFFDWYWRWREGKLITRRLRKLWATDISAPIDMLIIGGVALTLLSGRYILAVPPVAALDDVTSSSSLPGEVLVGIACLLCGRAIYTVDKTEKNLTRAMVEFREHTEKEFAACEQRNLNGRTRIEERMQASLHELSERVDSNDHRLGSDIVHVGNEIARLRVLLLGMENEQGGGISGEVRALRAGRHDANNQIMKVITDILREFKDDIEAVEKRLNSRIDDIKAA